MALCTLALQPGGSAGGCWPEVRRCVEAEECWVAAEPSDGAALLPLVPLVVSFVPPPTPPLGRGLSSFDMGEEPSCNGAPNTQRCAVCKV